MTSVNPRWIAAAVEDTPDGVLIEAEGQVVYVNQAYARLLGYRHAPELAHRSVSALIAPSDVSRLMDFGRWRTLQRIAPSSYDFTALKSDGSTLRLHASVAASHCDGKTFITSIVRLVDAEEKSEPLDRVPAHRSESDLPHHHLSPREAEVLALTLQGKRAKEIGLLLDIDVKTVATHRARMLQKLSLTGDRDLFEYAVRYGLVDWAPAP